MDISNPTSCKPQPATLIDGWISQYKTASALAACSTALYGFNIALASSNISLLWMHKKLSISRRKQIITYLYIVVMIAIASHAVVYTNMSVDGGVIDSLRNSEDPHRFLAATFLPQMPLSLPLAVMGADALLLYRCIILYQFTPLYARIALYILLTISVVSSVGGGVAAYCYVFDIRSSAHSQAVLSGVTPTTIGVNSVFALLIAARLIYAQKLSSKSEQDNGSRPYMTALAICVESSVLILLVAVAGVIWQDAIVLMPQISVLSPLLIIYRVAQGRADRTITRLEETLEFNHTQHGTVESDVTRSDQ